MVNIGVRIIGIDEIKQMLESQKMRDAISAGVQKAAQVVRDGVKLMPPVSAKSTGYGPEGIPVDTSRLRNSIDAQQTALFGASVQPHVDYQNYVYEGTSRMPPRPFFDWFLNDFGGLEKIQKTLEDAINKGMGQ